jgi:hypothetical protein
MYPKRPLNQIIDEATVIASNPDMLTDGPTSRRVIYELVRELADPTGSVQQLLAIASSLAESFKPAE